MPRRDFDRAAGRFALSSGRDMRRNCWKGLYNLVLHSRICKATPREINRRLTIGFELQIGHDLCWHLYGCFVIKVRLFLIKWQPVTFNRAVGYLLSKYSSGFCTGL